MANLGAENQAELLKHEMQVVARRLATPKNKTGSAQTSRIPRSAKKSDTFVISSTPKRVPLKTMPNSKVKSEKPENSKKISRRKPHVLRRPVDYTWNRGGRLKEIRIRTRARKFLFIWKRKTFGKMTFSEARAYHQNRVVRKYFAEWKGTWWEKCGEWRQNAKADIHFKFSSCNKAWKCWTSFFKQQKLKKGKLAVANHYFASAVCKKYTVQWKMYIQLRRVKKTMYNKAYEIAATSQTKKSWNIWKQRFTESSKEKQNNETATFHWVTKTQKKFWDIWVEQQQLHCEYKKQEMVADTHYQGMLLYEAFNAWRLYILERRQKARRFRKAMQFYVILLKDEVFLQWKIRYDERMAYYKRMNACEALSIKIKKRRYIAQWMHYVEMNKSQRRLEAIGNLHYNRLLKQKGLGAFTFSLQLRKNKNANNISANDFHVLKLQSNAWKRWQLRIEGQEEIYLQELSSIARDHYSVSLRKKAVAAFKQNCFSQKLKKANLVKADAHYIVKLLPNMFERWQQYVQQSRSVNKKRRLAQKFNEDVLLSKHFYEWWNNFEQAKETRTMERMAQMQYNESLLRSCLDKWQTKTRNILGDNQKDAVGRVHYRKALLLRSVTRWKLYVKELREKQRKLNFAESYHQESKVAGAWLLWRHYVTMQREKRAKKEKADKLYFSVLMKKCIAGWKKYHCKVSIVNAEADRRMRVKQVEILSVALAAWRRNALLERESRRKKVEALCHRNQYVSNLAFQKWRTWSAMHCYKKQQTQAKVDAARKQLQCGILKRYFERWVAAKRILQEENARTTIAIQHHDTKVCRVAIQAWMVFRYLELKNSLMSRQAENLYKNRLTRNSFARWNQLLLDKKDEQVLTGNALWHWALSLESKCLQRWSQYVAERKRKKARYADAMDRRRYVMLRHGCTQILRFHSDRLSSRTKQNACKQAKMRYSAYHLAWKYGKLWIEKVRKRLETAGPRTTAHSFPDDVHFTHDFQLDPARRLGDFEPWIARPFEAPLRVEYAKERSFLQNDPQPKPRAAPRLPDFMNDSLQRAGILPEQKPGPQPEPSTSQPYKLKNPLPKPYLPTLDDQNLENPPSIYVDGSGLILPSSGGDYCRDTSEQTRSNVVLLPPSAFTISDDGDHPEPFKTTTKKQHHSPQTFPYDGAAEKWLPSPKRSGKEPLLSPAKHHRHHRAPVNPHPTKTSPLSDFKKPDDHHDSTSPSSSIHSDKPAGSKLLSGENTVYHSTTLSPTSMHDDQPSCSGLTPHTRPQSSVTTRTATSRTFIASPSRDPVKEELLKIQKRLKEFQDLKSQLRVLKQQKHVLETWLAENLTTAPPTTSLDVGSVEAEIKQIQSEADDVIEELRNRKPEVEQYALRIRVLCSTPT